MSHLKSKASIQIISILLNLIAKCEVYCLTENKTENLYIFPFQVSGDLCAFKCKARLQSDLFLSKKYIFLLTSKHNKTLTLCSETLIEGKRTAFNFGNRFRVRI